MRSAGLSYLRSRESNGRRPVVDVARNLLDRSPPRSPHEPPWRFTAPLEQVAPGPVDMDLLAPIPNGWLGLLILD
jgi:hypothetical protein